MEEALAYSRMLKRRLEDEQETYDEVHNVLRSYKRRMIDPASVASRVQTLLHGKNDLIVGFNRFLPKEYAISVVHGDDHDHHKSSPSMASENIVCNDLLQFHNPLSKSAPWWANFFAKIMDDQDHGLINGNKLNHDHHDHNVQKVRETRRSEESIAGKKSAVEFINLVRKSLNDDQMYKKFLDAMVRYRRIKDLDNVEQEVSDLFKASPEIYTGFTTFLADAILAKKSSTSTEANHRLLPRSAKNGFKVMNVKNLNEKIMNRFEDDMFEQDVLLNRLESTMEALERLRQACEKKPTERKSDENLTEETHEENTTERTSEENLTEKTCWDFYAYKYFNWNEENLTERKYDEINATEGTCKEKPTEKTASKENLPKIIKVEDHLSVINLRCIERLYDESGIEMLDILRQNPKEASLVILKRLRQKFDELKQIRSQANKLRAKAIKKLHGKKHVIRLIRKANDDH